MNTQPEALLEDNLLIQLKVLDYSRVFINDKYGLLNNLNSQIMDSDTQLPARVPAFHRKLLPEEG